jgi:hypothetical protein
VPGRRKAKPCRHNPPATQRPPRDQPSTNAPATYQRNAPTHRRPATTRDRVATEIQTPNGISASQPAPWRPPTPPAATARNPPTPRNHPRHPATAIRSGARPTKEGMCRVGERRSRAATTHPPPNARNVPSHPQRTRPPTGGRCPHHAPVPHMSARRMPTTTRRTPTTHISTKLKGLSPVETPSPGPSTQSEPQANGPLSIPHVFCVGKSPVNRYSRFTFSAQALRTNMVVCP